MGEGGGRWRKVRAHEIWRIACEMEVFSFLILCPSSNTSTLHPAQQTLAWVTLRGTGGGTQRRAAGQARGAAQQP